MNRTDLTQVSTTKGTYQKTGEFLKHHLQPNSKILSVGAGLDQTREGLRAGLGDDHEIHDFEPNQSKQRSKDWKDIVGVDRQVSSRIGSKSYWEREIVPKIKTVNP